MSDLTRRRTFLKQLASAAAGSGLAASAAAGADSSAPAASPRDSGSSRPGGGKLSAYAFQSRVWIHVDDRPFACYRAEPTQKYPYVYPVAGPVTGLSMTTESGVPYPHHRSLLFACDHVNGANYWQQGVDRGRIVSQGPQVAVAGPDRVVVADVCRWQPGQGPAVIEDQREFTFSAPQPDLRLIDAKLTWTARIDVHVAKTNHSLFALRAARDLAPIGGGTLVNAVGQRGEKATFGQRAPWCGYHATRLGQAEAIVLMDHPDNPWSPCPWFTRDYGFVSPTPFQWLDEKGWSLPQDESLTLRYRVAASGGAFSAERMNALYEGFKSASR